METALLFSIAVALSWFMAYNKAKLTTVTYVLAVVLIVGTFYDQVSWFTWLIFLAIATVLNARNIRKTYISAPIFKAFKKITPEMSQTEKEALDAGTTWWEGDLFRGDPDWEKLHNFPKPRLTAEEKAFLEGPVEEVCRMTDDWEVAHQRADLSPEVWQYLKDHKFFAMIIKKEFGGLEFSAYAQSRVLQKLTSVSSVLSSTVGVPNSLGPGELLQHYGTDDQKAHYLPRLATGEEIPCFALTSPEAGSDAGSIPDFGIVCEGEFKGEKVLGMKLTWDKRYITLAPIATVLGLAFKLYDPEKLLGDKEDLGITCALIPTDIEGVITGRRHFPLNVPFQNGPTQGEGVFVPLSYIIGGAEMAGQGWRMLVECLSVGRSITLPSNSAGGIKSIALATGAYARIRRQFKLPIGKMEGIEEPLARITGNAYLMDAVTTLSTGSIDLGEKPSVIGAICKYHLTEKMRDCVKDSMDIHGGKGICLGPNNYLGRGYQGAPIAITVEGANILTRNMIIYGQGAIRCHPYVLAELDAVTEPNEEKGLDEFDHALFGHIGFTISNAMRSLWFSLTGARFVKSPRSDKTARYYQIMTRFSSNLAILSDLSMASLGGDLKRRERMSARLGDVLSYLYLASATLKRYEDEGRLVEDLPLLQWAVEDSLYQAQHAIDELISNFPNKWVGGLMRVLVMPFGKVVAKPSDRLDHKLARIIQTPSETRNRLGQGQYLTREPENLLGTLEQTLDNILACEPIFDRVCKAAGEKLPFYRLNLVADKGLELKVISVAEAELLRKTETGRKATIDVDDFNSLDLTGDKELSKSNIPTNTVETKKHKAA